MPCGPMRTATGRLSSRPDRFRVDTRACLALLEVIRRSADGAHFGRGRLVVVLVETGPLGEARRHAADILAADPGSSAKRLITALCFHDPAVNERLRKSFQAAGLPE